jgi:hypothetical protein
MISMQDTIKYVGMALILFCLLKAFMGNLDNQKLALIITLVVGMTFLIANSRDNCPLKEGYTIVNPPLVDSIYPGAENIDSPDIPPVYPEHKQYSDEDIENMKDIVALDKQTYERLISNENKAKNKIISNYKNEMAYSESNPFNTVPLGTQLYGYTYLPPENWFRAYERPPVCVSDKRSAVNPMVGDSVCGLMQFDTSRNVTGPDGINIQYVKNKLNKDTHTN